MRTLLALLFLLRLPALLAQGQYDLDDPAYPEPPYAPYEIESQDYYDYAGNDLSPQTPEEHFQSQQQNQQEVIPAPTPDISETEPTEPGPLDCQEEQYPCTRLYSIYKPCKQCLNEICFYSLRRVYVINKEICVRTVCAHEELLRGTYKEGVCVCVCVSSGRKGYRGSRWLERLFWDTPFQAALGTALPKTWVGGWVVAC
ncbi:microfibrillar-associated protein 2 isoform 2-T2 [Vipera latastei]